MIAANKAEKLARADWRAYVILDPEGLRDKPASVPAQHQALLEVARAALEGGAGLLQLRHKDATARELIEFGRALKALCDQHDALFIINDRLDVALSCGADGVHIGPRDISLEDARVIAPKLLIGCSAGTLERAKALEALGADYLGVGAIYDAHAIKQDASTPQGPGLIGEISAEVKIPVVGIGGITHENAAAVSAQGARGVAVIREVVAAVDPGEAVQILLASVDEGIARST